MNSFKELELRPQILRGVDEAGFEKPFPIQQLAIGPLLAGRDIIGQAKTGSGKTAAFGLPMLQAIDTARNDVQALVLAPTRELAVQIRDEITRLGAYTGVQVLAIYGGQSINTQLDHLRRGVHVVVGTPGRVIDHIKRGTLDLRRARYVVLDEADTMLDMGFIDDIELFNAPSASSCFAATCAKNSCARRPASSQSRSSTSRKVPQRCCSARARWPPRSVTLPHGPARLPLTPRPWPHGPALRAVPAAEGYSQPAQLGRVRGFRRELLRRFRRRVSLPRISSHFRIEMVHKIPEVPRRYARRRLFGEAWYRSCW